MLRNLSEHEKGMRLLILFLLAYACFALLNNIISIHRIYGPAMFPSNDPVTREGGDGFYTLPDSDQGEMWKSLFSVATTMLINIVVMVLAAFALLFRKRWGWWLTGTICLHWSIGSVLAFVQLFFMRMPDTGQPMILHAPGQMGRLTFYVVATILVVRYLLRPAVQIKYNIPMSTSGIKVASFFGLALLYFGVTILVSYIFYFI